VLSNGRVVLGVGTGGREEDFRAVGALFEKRLAKMETQVGRMRELWRGVPPHEGASPIGPKPLQDGGPPVLVGAILPHSVSRCARWADGLCGFTFGPDIDQVEKSYELFESAWNEAGRSGSPRKISSFWYALGPDAECQMETFVRRYLAIFGTDTVETMVRHCSATSAARMRELLRQFKDIGTDELVLVPTSEDPDEIDRATQLIAEL
jgi:alkanesulfonate monooxygenase SsuD/methylene tetrahydromethanopterin reductase-like flavin-dependent oxidoreductase (luciferase family)